MSDGRIGVVLGETLWRHLPAANSRDRIALTCYLRMPTLVTLPSGDPPFRGSERTTPIRPSPVTKGYE
jgi:hypothetical protein